MDNMVRNPMLDDDMFKRHIARLEASTVAHSKDTICEFLTTHTKLRGRLFSFKDHEYQEQILRDQSREKVIIKSAQMGISEMSARLALAMGALIDGFSTIYTLPSALAAANFMKTRIDPVIQSSPYLSELVSKQIDNTMIKRFGESYLYLKGAQVDSQAISVPADMLVCDEVDNSNPEVMTLFESRLIHSPYQYNVKLSTPSIPNFGIHLAYQQSRRHVHLCKCRKCNEWFEPDYFNNVKIPDFKGEISDIVKQTFANPNFRWVDAYVACPKCGRAADLQEKNRSWVCENPTDNFVAAGFKVSPFSCPNIIMPGALVKSSVDYKRKQDFYNQRLGLAMEDKESTLTEDELRQCIINDYISGSFPMVMGLDMGSECACTIGAMLPDKRIVIVHTEMIPLFNVVERRRELALKWKVRMCVVDHGPYTETVYRMQQSNSNVFAAVYVRNLKSVDLYKVKEVEADEENGKPALKQVNISRDKVFDLIMSELRQGNIKKVAPKGDKEERDTELWISNLQDQKRVREYSREEVIFVWRKSEVGDDHYHHSLLYVVVASMILGVASNSAPMTTLMTKFRVTNRDV